MDQETKVNESFQRVVDTIKKTSPIELTDAQAHEAARVSIEFCKTLLAIHRRMIQNHKHDKHN